MDPAAVRGARPRSAGDAGDRLRRPILAPYQLPRGWRRGPITGARADSKAIASDLDLESMMAGRAILWREAEQVLRLQFGAELLDGFLKAFEPGERKCDSTSAFGERLRGVGFSEADEFSDAAQEINALFRS